MKKRVAAIIQARMSSRRLPGKMLRVVDGHPLLHYVLERVRRCESLSDIWVATSSDSSDEPIASFCSHRGVQVFRGDLEDVAGRFRDALKYIQCDGMLRICGDSPWVEPALLDRAIEIFGKGEHQLITNLCPRSFPRGISVELLDSSLYTKACAHMTNPRHREHITGYFYEHLDDLSFHNIVHEGGDLSEAVDLSIDTSDDFARFERMLLLAGGDWKKWSYLDVVDAYWQTT